LAGSRTSAQTAPYSQSTTGDGSGSTADTCYGSTVGNGYGSTVGDRYGGWTDNWYDQTTTDDRVTDPAGTKPQKPRSRRSGFHHPGKASTNNKHIDCGAPGLNRGTA